MTTIEIIALITSGLFVGFINTLAGGGTIISLTVLMLLGLPPSVANGTNRVAIVLQNLTSVANFKKKKYLDTKKGLKLGIPTVIGSIVGVFIVVKLDEQIIQYCFGAIMVVMLFFLIYKPDQWLKGKEELLNKPITWKIYVLMFFIGVYGGVIHVGIGYFILFALIFGMGFDLVKGNAMKNLLVLMYVPFTLIIFVLNDQVRWDYGLTHAIGNIIGAYVASKWAMEWGAKFVRYLMMVISAFSVLQMIGVLDLRSFIQGILH